MRQETSEIKAHQGTRLVGAKAAADRLGLSVWTVYAWARTGRVPSVRLGARRLFAPEDLEQLITANRTSASNSALPDGQGKPPDKGTKT